MSEQQAGWSEAAKWLGGLGAAAAAVRSYFRARNVNHSDRIVRLERQNMEMRRVMNNAVEELQGLASTVDIDRGDNHRRFQRVEGDLRTLKRETRDKLLEIADTLGEQLGRSSPGNKPEPRG